MILIVIFDDLIFQCRLDSITATLLKKDNIIKVIINFYAKLFHIILKLFDLSHSTMG